MPSHFNFWIQSEGNELCLICAEFCCKDQFYDQAGLGELKEDEGKGKWREGKRGKETVGVKGKAELRKFESDGEEEEVLFIKIVREGEKKCEKRGGDR